MLHPHGGKHAWVELLKPLQYKVEESNDDMKRSEKTQKLISNFYATLLWQRHCLPSVSNDSVTAVNYERRIVALMSNKGKKQHRQNPEILNLKRFQTEARYWESERNIFLYAKKWETPSIEISIKENDNIVRDLFVLAFHAHFYSHIPHMWLKF